MTRDPAPPFAPLAAANEFLVLRPDGIDGLALHRLLYLADGWRLALKGGPLLAERPTLGRFGPVYPSLATVIPWTPGLVAGPQEPGRVGLDAPRLPPEAAFERRLIRWTARRYAVLTQNHLTRILWAPGTPCREAEARREGIMEMPEASDRAWFSQLAREEGVTSEALGA